MTDAPARVMITCPQTGSAAATMLRLKPGAFEALLGPYSFRCVQCGQVHAWHKRDAWLESPRAR